MGWENYHLHEFIVVNPKFGEVDHIGTPDNEGFNDAIIPEQKRKISSYFSLGNTQGIYMYDFGDEWEHKIELEKILPAEAGHLYPKCLAGKRACPPEDCGGMWGYENLLEILKDPHHPEYQDRLEWIGEPLNPEEFDSQSVLFSASKTG
tara:strand:- start:337 stop:783 length:447 start_codon:yes stop_codon:yes gene_type:complete